MKNFVVLFKPIKIPNNFETDKLHYDFVQIDFLMQQLIKENQSTAATGLSIQNDYTIDEKSVSFQTIGGKLCLAMIAYRKG